MIRTALLLLAALLTMDSARITADEPADVSPKGPFAGPLDIPDIARYRRLPWRMLLEPNLPEPEAEVILPPQFVPLFITALEQSEDSEIRQHAAESLALLSGKEQRDISAALPVLRETLRTETNGSIRDAAALALVMADDRDSGDLMLAQLSGINEATRLIVEPALARWRPAGLADAWIARLGDPRSTNGSFRLATEGLAAVQATQAAEQLAALAADISVPFGKRASAAAAVGMLDAARGRNVAAGLLDGDLQDRLVAVRLLAADDPESSTLLLTLCTDPSDAIAAAAWQTVFEHNSEQLLPLLDSGRQHRDAGVRMTAARTMQLYPDAIRVTWLDALIGDFHLQVRNVARAVLFTVAEQQDEHKQQIVSQAVARLTGDAAAWQAIEQSLLLLGQLRQDTFSAECIPLLRNPRPEVYVTAAWLIHLFPDDAVVDAVTDAVRERDGMLSLPTHETGIDILDTGLQVGLLFHYFGLQRDPRVDDVLEAQFSKAAPGGPEKRAAAMWALGLIHENEPDNPLVGRFEERMTDTEGINPELPIVRRLSTLSIGRLRSVKSVPLLLTRIPAESLSSRIPQTVRWNMQVMQQPVPVLPDPSPRFVGGFRLNPYEASP